MGYFFSSHKAQNFLKNLKIKLAVPKNEAQTKGLVDYDWKRFTGEGDEAGEILIFTLRNGKVYVGFLLYVDYGSDVSEGQKAIRILPLKSGLRQSDGNVKYITYYPFHPKEEVPKKLPEEKESTGEKSTENNLFDEIGLLDLPELTLFQREIVSYTVFDLNLDSFFGHSQERDHQLDD